MAARATAGPTVSAKEEEPVHIEERIRQRAYQIYLQRDGAEGTALDDWLQAEHELTHVVEQNYIHQEEVADSAPGS